MKTKGFDAFISKLDKIVEEKDDRIEKSLNRVAKVVMKDVKKNTPVDTGALRRSWSVEKTNPNTIVVYNTRKYAPHVEYGHRTRGTGMRRRKGKKIAYVQGRFMLRNAIKRAGKTELKLVVKDILHD